MENKDTELTRKLGLVDVRSQSSLEAQIGKNIALQSRTKSIEEEEKRLKRAINALTKVQYKRNTIRTKFEHSRLSVREKAKKDYKDLDHEYNECIRTCLLYTSRCV